MKYIPINGLVIPKHCIYGPRPAEGIVLENSEWWRVTDHLDKDQREKDLAAALKAKEEAKRELSHDMTRDWSNTLASIKTQGNQKRLENREKEKQDKIDQYYAILKNREEENKKYCEKMRKLASQEDDAMKTVNSGVLYALVVEGREKQIERKNLKKIEEVKKDKELAQRLQKDADDFHREIMEQRMKERDKSKQKQFLDLQMEDKKRRKQKDIEEFEAAKQDIINMRLEIEKIQNCNKIEKNFRKKHAEKYAKPTDAELELRRKMALEQEVEDEINQIYLNYERKIKKERKCREQKMKNEDIEARMKIAEMLGQKLMENARKEEEILNTALEKAERRARREEEENKEKRRRALEDLLEGKRIAEERMAREAYEKREERKWVMIQQYRSAEINEEKTQAERRKKRETQQALRKALDCQMKQKAERDAQELKEWLTPLEDENRHKADIVEYCQEAMDFAKEQNLPDYPIRLAIGKIKRINGIIDKNDLEQTQDEGAMNMCRKQKTRTLGSGCYCLKY